MILLLIIIPLITDHDLLAVLTAIKPVVDWRILGLGLGIQKYQLDIIAIENHWRVTDCKMEMISKWFTSSNSSNTSWQCLVRALVSVNETTLAIQIAKQHGK